MTETLTAERMIAALSEGACTSEELTQHALRQAGAVGAELGAFMTLCADQALEQARASDARRANGERHGALDGVPIAIKDLQETAGVRTTYGCASFAEHVPTVDAPSVACLRRAGAVIIGKTSTPPWGTLGETKHRMGPPASNPVDRSLTTGGSSGGSAAAVAAGIVPLATGTDSAGSVTAPAALCGVIGVRPTRGLIANPPDQEFLLRADVGILARTPGDAALALDAMIGFDPSDPHSLRGKPRSLWDEVRRLDLDDPQPLSGVRVLVAPTGNGYAVEPAAVNACTATAKKAAELGALVSEGELPGEDPMRLYLDLYGTDMRYALGDDADAWNEMYPETLDDLQEGPPLTAEQYLGRLNELWRLQSAIDQLFVQYEIVLTPATATAAFPHDRPPESIAGKRVRPGWASFMPFSVLWNMVGNPTASIPAGTDAEALPLGCLVIAGKQREDLILCFASAMS